MPNLEPVCQPNRGVPGSWQGSRSYSGNKIAKTNQLQQVNSLLDYKNVLLILHYNDLLLLLVIDNNPQGKKLFSCSLQWSSECVFSQRKQYRSLGGLTVLLKDTSSGWDTCQKLEPWMKDGLSLKTRPPCVQYYYTWAVGGLIIWDVDATRAA